VTTASLPFASCGPEVLFRVRPCEYDGETLSASMPIGPWLNDGRRATAGALSVLVDDVLGYTLVATSPPGRWSVSAEITLDLLAPLPASGTVRASASAMYLDRIGGFSTGKVLDEDGQLLAVCTQRGRYVPAPGIEFGDVSFTEQHGCDNIIPWLSERFVGPQPTETPDLLGNPLGNVHGGISLCLAALNAEDVAPEHLEIASLHIVYARPIPIGARLAHQIRTVHQGRGLMTLAITGELAGRPATLTRVVLQPRDRSVSQVSGIKI